MRRAALTARDDEWRVRSRSVLDALIEACGGAAEGGHVVETPGKVVRIDYLRRAIDELTRDETSRHAFYHRGVPVNVEAWLSALCAHDVATYVPTRWTRKRSRRRELAAANRDGGLPLSFPTTTRRIRNDVFECETFVDSLVEASRARGVLLERVGDGERADLVFGSRGRAIEGLPPSHDIVEGARDVETYAASRLSLLDVEELTGLFSRGGRVVVSGARDEWWVGFAVEANGDVVRTYDAEHESGRKLPFCPGDAVCRPAPPTPFTEDRQIGQIGQIGVAVPNGTWTIVASEFRDDERTTIRVHATSGLSVDVVAHTETTRDGARSAALARRVANLVVANEATPEPDGRPSAESTISRTKSDIARLLAMVVKREHEPWVTDALRRTDNKTRDRVTTTAAHHDIDDDEVERHHTSTTTTMPTACRNAWVLSDGRTVEAGDKTLTRAIIGRRRWNVGKKCPGCQRSRHPDPFVAGRTACSSPSCERAFRVFSTTTHWKFKNGRRRRIELDMNAPLFTDESLALLKSSE